MLLRNKIIRCSSIVFAFFIIVSPIIPLFYSTTSNFPSKLRFRISVLKMIIFFWISNIHGVFRHYAKMVYKIRIQSLLLFIRLSLVYLYKNVMTI